MSDQSSEYSYSDSEDEFVQDPNTVNASQQDASGSGSSSSGSYSSSSDSEEEEEEAPPPPSRKRKATAAPASDDGPRVACRGIDKKTGRPCKKSYVRRHAYIQHLMSHGLTPGPEDEAPWGSTAPPAKKQRASAVQKSAAVSAPAGNDNVADPDSAGSKSLRHYSSDGAQGFEWTAPTLPLPMFGWDLVEASRTELQRLRERAERALNATIDHLDLRHRLLAAGGPPRGEDPVRVKFVETMAYFFAVNKAEDPDGALSLRRSGVSA